MQKKDYKNLAAFWIIVWQISQTVAISSALQSINTLEEKFTIWLLLIFSPYMAILSFLMALLKPKKMKEKSLQGPVYLGIISLHLILIGIYSTNLQSHLIPLALVIPTMLSALWITFKEIRNESDIHSISSLK